MQTIIRKRLADFLQIFGFISAIKWIMVERRQMGNAALEAVNRSAEEATRGLNALRPIVNQKITEAETYRRIGIGIDALQNILRLLASIGAKIKP